MFSSYYRRVVMVRNASLLLILLIIRTVNLTWPVWEPASIVTNIKLIVIILYNEMRVCVWNSKYQLIVA